MKIMLFLSMKGGVPVGADLRAEIGEKMGTWMADLEEKGTLENTYPLHPANEASLFPNTLFERSQCFAGKWNDRG